MTKPVTRNSGAVVRSGRFVRALTSLLVFPLIAISVFGQTDKTLRKQELRLLFAGDILLSRQVEVETKTGLRSPWANLHKLFQSADWVGGNFEGTIGLPKDCIGSKSPCFATPDSAAQLLKRSGFYAVTAENNHAGDLGSTGRGQTQKTFQQAGLAAVDFENSPQFFHVGNAEIALIAITMVPAADGRVQHIPSDEVLEKLRLAKVRANIVLVSIHWGNEYMDWPSPSQRKAAAWLVEQGADVVFGHHPHVIQRPECITGKPVFFSLGNHVFDQENPKTKQGMIADCRIRNGRLHCQGLRTQTKPGTTFPTLVSANGAPDTVLATCAPEIKANHADGSSHLPAGSE
jgi:poly-gamma-glutamate synthesis protein (capsule biosynthesis protein)